MASAGALRGRKGVRWPPLGPRPVAPRGGAAAVLLCTAVAAGTTFVGNALLRASNLGSTAGGLRQHQAASPALAAAAGGVAEARKGLFEDLFARDRRPVVLYDGVCNMCNSAVNVALDKDPEGRKLRFAALQSEVGRGLLVFCGRKATDLSSMVVVRPDGKCLVKSDAALFVGQQLDSSPVLRGASEVASRFLPKVVRDAAYNTVADNRYRVLGKRDELRLDEEGQSDRFISDLPQPSVSGA